MEKSQKYYLSLLILMMYTNLLSQVNCNIIDDKNCKKSCETVKLASEHQGFSVSQEAFDLAIKLCPKNDEAYLGKSIPYLKRGDFITWKRLIDKAVELNPRMNLGYRGWCRYQFLRDYKGAITDFETLEKIQPNGLGYSQNGNYHLEIVRGICYSAIGQKAKAISIIEKQINKKNYTIGIYDYYQLGVTYYDSNQFDKALENFEKQSKISDFAENIYFKAKVSKIRNKDFLDLKKLALKSYDEGKFMKDSYTHHYNKIYRKQIVDL